MGTGTNLRRFLCPEQEKKNGGVPALVGTSSPTDVGSRLRVRSQMKRFVSSAAIAIPCKINICAHAPPAGLVQLARFRHAWGWQVTKTVDMVRAKLLLGKFINTLTSVFDFFNGLHHVIPNFWVLVGYFFPSLNEVLCGLLHCCW